MLGRVRASTPAAWPRCSSCSPTTRCPRRRFVYHELALTDGAGHDYGPHSDGLADALAESDRRIGRVLDLLEAEGLFDETLFVVHRRPRHGAPGRRRCGPTRAALVHGPAGPPPSSPSR